MKRQLSKYKVRAIEFSAQGKRKIFIFFMKQHSNRLLLYFRERYNNKVGELDSLEQDETNPNGQTGKFFIHD